MCSGLAFSTTQTVDTSISMFSEKVVTLLKSRVFKVKLHANIFFSECVIQARKAN
jgi:diphthamide synthase subunit DPH2